MQKIYESQNGQNERRDGVMDNLLEDGNKHTNDKKSCRWHQIAALLAFVGMMIISVVSSVIAYFLGKAHGLGDRGPENAISNTNSSSGIPLPRCMNFGDKIKVKNYSIANSDIARLKRLKKSLDWTNKPDWQIQVKGAFLNQKKSEVADIEAYLATELPLDDEGWSEVFKKVDTCENCQNEL